MAGNQRAFGKFLNLMIEAGLMRQATAVTCRTRYFSMASPYRRPMRAWKRRTESLNRRRGQMKKPNRLNRRAVQGRIRQATKGEPIPQGTLRKSPRPKAWRGEHALDLQADCRPTRKGERRRDRSRRCRWQKRSSCKTIRLHCKRIQNAMANMFRFGRRGRRIQGLERPARWQESRSLFRAS